MTKQEIIDAMAKAISRIDSDAKASGNLFGGLFNKVGANATIFIGNFQVQ